MSRGITGNGIEREHLKCSVYVFGEFMYVHGGMSNMAIVNAVIVEI